MTAVSEQILWETSLTEGQQHAAKEDKPIIVDFSAAPECIGCLAMEKLTYRDPRVIAFFDDECIPVKVGVRQHKDLADEYLVTWTPNVVVADGEGRVHHRIEGYLPPEAFVASLMLGVGKYWLHRQEFALARQRFEEVARRNPGTEAGAEALYWLAVTFFNEGHNPEQLRANWQRLAQEYPRSHWTLRTKIPPLK